MQLHVTARKATVAYSLHNSSIVSIKPSGAEEPVPFVYSAEDILDVLSYVLNSNTGREGNFTLVLDVSQAFLTRIAGIILANSFLGVTSTVEHDLFRSLLTLPMYFVNAGMVKDNVLEGQHIPLENHIKGYLAKDHFLLTISKYTLYVYTALALFTLLWCVIICGYCWFEGGVLPNSSVYPEIDFAGKCRGNDSGMGSLLKGLGNATSKEVEKRIAKKHVFAGERRYGAEDGEVILTTTKIGYELEAGRKYL
jgi:hypothetical protein